MIRLGLLRPAPVCPLSLCRFRSTTRSRFLRHSQCRAPSVKPAVLSHVVCITPGLFSCPILCHSRCITPPCCLSYPVLVRPNAVSHTRYRVQCCLSRPVSYPLLLFTPGPVLFPLLPVILVPGVVSYAVYHNHCNGLV